MSWDEFNLVQTEHLWQCTPHADYRAVHHDTRAKGRFSLALKHIVIMNSVKALSSKTRVFRSAEVVGGAPGWLGRRILRYQCKCFAFSGTTCASASRVVLCLRELNLHDSFNIVLYIQIQLSTPNTENELSGMNHYKSSAFLVALIRHVLCMFKLSCFLHTIIFILYSSRQW